MEFAQLRGSLGRQLDFGLLVCFAWEKSKCPPLVLIMNCAPNRSQCYVQLPFEELREQMVRAQDLMSTAAYERDGDELVHHGLYMDLPGWGYYVFKIEKP